VVDFTNETDDTIIDFFSNYTGNACGRFTDEQLNRPISKIELKSASNFLKYAAGLLLPFSFFSSKGTSQQVQKKGKELDEIIVIGYSKRVGKVVRVGPRELTAGPAKLITKDTFKINTIPNQQSAIEHLLVTKTRCIGGQSKLIVKSVVVDAATGEPLPHATIKIKGSNKSTISDVNGNFSIEADNSKSVLAVSYVGFVTQEIKVADVKENTRILLSAASLGYGEVVIVGMLRTKKKITTGTGSVKLNKRQSLKDSLVSLFKTDRIKIYPNPVSVSGTILISFNKLNPGVYQIRILNTEGQLFYSFQRQITSPNETEQIHLHERMSAGVYILQVLDEKKKLMQANKMVIQ
jgi:hypothetical protein